LRLGNECRIPPSASKISQGFEGNFYFLPPDLVLEAERTGRAEKIKIYPNTEEIFQHQLSDQRERHSKRTQSAPAEGGMK
jgi:hypothetical protein